MSYTTTHDTHELTIRVAGPEHAGQLRRLAQRDSATIPDGELLVALVGEQVRAAISISDGGSIADPFHPSADLVALLSKRASQLRGPRGRGLRSRLAGRRAKPGRARLSPQPAGTLRPLN